MVNKIVKKASITKGGKVSEFKRDKYIWVDKSDNIEKPNTFKEADKLARNPEFVKLFDSLNIYIRKSVLANKSINDFLQDENVYSANAINILKPGNTDDKYITGSIALEKLNAIVLNIYNAAVRRLNIININKDKGIFKKYYLLGKTIGNMEDNFDVALFNNVKNQILEGISLDDATDYFTYGFYESFILKCNNIAEEIFKNGYDIELYDFTNSDYEFYTKRNFYILKRKEYEKRLKKDE